MSKVAVRGVCALILVLTVAVRFQADRTRQTMMSEFDAGRAIADVLRSHGLKLGENPVKPPKMASIVVYFQRPECDRASLVFPYFINAEAEPLLAHVTVPGFERRFYYMDSSWREQRRVSMFFEWLKYAALDLVGASPYMPVKTAIVLADPPNCRPTDIIDWRVLWEKNRPRNPVNAGSGAGSEAARS
jgi:DTW domain-containing protein YfiP